jgi:hypothetical protein
MRILFFGSRALFWILIGSSSTMISNWTYKLQKKKGKNDLLAKANIDTISAFGQP